VTTQNRLLRSTLLIGVACAAAGFVAHVSLGDRAYVIAGMRSADLLLEIALVFVALAGAILIESALQCGLVFAAAIAFLVEELATPAAPAGYVFALGLAVTGLAWGFLAVALVTLPGRRTAWIWLAALTAGAVTAGPLAAATWMPDRHGCADCPVNALAVFDSPRWSDGFARWGAIAMVVAAAAVALRSLLGGRSFHVLPERGAAGALSIGMTISLLPRIRDGVDTVPSPTARLLAGLSLAVGALALALPDVQRARRRAAIRGLATRLAAAPAPGRLGEEVARTVGDPTIAVAFPITGGALVNEEGLPVRQPGRGATRIVREGRHLATVFHAARTFADDDEVASLTRVAGLALEHERARAEQKAQARELRASRRRLVEASDRERRRLEHDLHDGAQQRLVSLLLAVGSTRAADKAAQEALTGVAGHLQAAISELRTLTHGLFPSVLANEGLAPAIEDLELSSTAIVEVLELPTQPAPLLVESTAYLAAALAVASATSSVQLRVRSTTETVVVEARGVTASDSLEWRALRERVGALEGKLVTFAGEIRVELPCAS
jgi:signal transduction histidine kinase